MDSYCSRTTTTRTRWGTGSGTGRRTRRGCRLPSVRCSSNFQFTWPSHALSLLLLRCFLSVSLSLSRSPALCAFEAFVLPLGMLYQRPQTTAAATSLFACCMQLAKFTKAHTHTHIHRTHTQIQRQHTDLRTYSASQVV